MSSSKQTQTIMVHYNIAKKLEINPFDGVKVVTLSSHSRGKELLQGFLDRKSEDSVETRKINGSWVIAYDINHLDFTTLIEWYSPIRGKFQFRAQWIHFTIEDDVMACF